MMQTENNGGLLLLEDFTQYHKSLKWKIQDSYYGNRGRRAWLNAEIPYYATSNSIAAKQNAELVFSALNAMESAKEIKKSDPINILEMASGLGLFAINFIYAFKELDDKYKKGYFSRLKFYFTDQSRKNLEDAYENKTIRNFYNEGVLIFAELDALNPKTLKYLFRNKIEKTPQMTAIIANYMHVIMPVKILKKKGNKYYEKFVKTSLRLTNMTMGIKSADDLVKYKDLQKIREFYIKKILWKKIEDDFYVNKLHKILFESTFKKYDEFEMVYPYGSFRNIDESIKLLNDHGVIIISDVGYADVFQVVKRGKTDQEYIENYVNMPLLEKYAKKIGMQVNCTHNQFGELQTLVVSKTQNLELEKLFNKFFVKNDANLELVDYFSAGEKFLRDKQFRYAIRFYKKALKLGSKDSEVYYDLGSAYAGNGEISESIDMITKGKQNDYFNYINVDFRLGYAYYRQGKFYKAIKLFKQSFAFKKSFKVYYNLGLCYESLKKNADAKKYYQMALAINPNYDKCKLRLKNLQFLLPKQ